MAKRSANWTSDEEMVLVEEVGKRENVLFGKMKGDGAIKIGQIRSNGWQEVVEVLNARFSFKRREANEIKKKYYNIKQRSKEKLDQIKRPKTGGGQCVGLTDAEDLFLQTNEGRPQVEGLLFGIDSDELPGCSALLNSTSIPSTSVSTASTSASASTVADACNGGQEETSTTTEECQAACPEKGVDKRKKVDARKRKHLADLEEENLKLDNVRLHYEVERLKTLSEIMAIQKEVLLLKKSKLEFEIQANYPFFNNILQNSNEC